MRQSQKVLWTKGVLLSPQHLQAQDRFLEDLIAFQLASLSSFPWGFSRLELDAEALATGSLRCTAAAGLLPDGLLFDIPAADAPPAPKALEPFWHPDQQEMLVYLALPEHRLGGRNVSTVESERNTRYLSEVVMRRDENTGLAEKPIQVARKNFRLLTEGEAQEGNTALPVARITRSAAGTYQLDPRFVPPLLDFGASDYLVSLARRLVELLSAKSSSLSGMRRQRNVGLANFGASDVGNFWLLYTVNAHLPRLRHLYESGRGHPSELYTAMLDLAGALTTFSSTVHPRDLPGYDHAALGACFTRLDALLRELLETVVPANHVSLPLREVEPSIYATAIEQDRYLAAPQIYLAVSAQTRPDELIRKVPQLLKLSSADQIQQLVRQALPGVALRHVPVPPSAVPVKLTHQYFQLDRAGPAWDAIRQARNASVYVPSDFPEAQIELLILLPPERERGA